MRVSFVADTLTLTQQQQQQKCQTQAAQKVSLQNFSLYIITINLYLDWSDLQQGSAFTWVSEWVCVQMCISKSMSASFVSPFYPRHLFSFTCSDSLFFSFSISPPAQHFVLFRWVTLWMTMNKKGKLLLCENPIQKMFASEFCDQSSTLWIIQVHSKCEAEKRSEKIPHTIN